MLIFTENQGTNLNVQISSGQVASTEPLLFGQSAMGKWGKILRIVTTWSSEEEAGRRIEDGRYGDNFLLLCWHLQSDRFTSNSTSGAQKLPCVDVSMHISYSLTTSHLHSRYETRSGRINLPHSQTSQGWDALLCFSVSEKMRTDKGKEKTKETL